MQLALSKIVDVISGTVIQTKHNLQETFPVQVITDSRLPVLPENSLFFALKGANYNAHNFLDIAYQKGIRILVVSQQVAIEKFPEATIINVDDTLLALQQLAAFHRRSFNGLVAAITGSNGKTMVKEWLWQLLKADFSVCRNPKSYNSQVGVPLSILQLQPHHQIGVFEAGISQPGEMRQLQKIICPETGILTNIGDAHQANFTDYYHKLNEKLQLFASTKSLIFYENELVNKAVLAEKLPAVKLCSVSLYNHNADYYFSHHTNQLILHVNKKKIEFDVPFNDSVSVYNIALIIAFVLENKLLNVDILREKIQTLIPVSMRMEIIDGIRNLTLINDAYNYDITGLTHALEFAWKNKRKKPLSVILSDLPQITDDSNYATISKLINQYKIEHLFLVGNNIANYAGLFNAVRSSLLFTSVDALIRSGELTNLADETILLKGSRTFAFEKIVNFLQEKKHSTRLEINLEAIRHNFNYFKSQLQTGTKLMVMVKAFAYGAGANEISHLLTNLNADYFGVAYTDEGVLLRQAGITKPIMVMNPEPESFDVLIKNRLEPELFSFKILELFVEKLKQQSISQPYPVHIKIDTGMHRLGFEPQQTGKLIKTLLSYKNYLLVKSIFSHLSAADNSQLDDFTEQQIQLFTTTYNQLSQGLNQKPLGHILNSNGIIRFPQAQFDMVRLGIGLYGLVEDVQTEKKLQSVFRLITTITQIKTIKKGESVGYNNAFVAEKNMKIAVLSIGYADGLHRILSHKNVYFKVQNKPVKPVGNICMDMTMIDVSKLSTVKEGDEVEIFSSNSDIKALAKEAQTIPYEVLTAISQRIRRVIVNA